MSTLVEIEEAVGALPRQEQVTLWNHLSKMLRSPAQPTKPTSGKCWPVPPPDVSKEETQRIARIIDEEFGGVEWESWK